MCEPAALVGMDCVICFLLLLGGDARCLTVCVALSCAQLTTELQNNHQSTQKDRTAYIVKLLDEVKLN